MRIDLLVQGAPFTTAAAERACAFARAALAAGHRVGSVFFYKDAVAVGNRFATDDDGARDAWRMLAAEGGFELMICISAAGRRGVVENRSVADGFVIVGLGQLIQAMEECDRLVTF